MTQPSQAAQAAAVVAPDPSANGTHAPGAAPEEECEDCVSKGEIGLAVLGGLIGAAILIIAIDVGTGYRLSRALGLGPRAAQEEEAPGVGGS